VENNDFRIADATKSSLSPRVRFGLWFKGRAQHVRARLNYCEGDLGGCVIINTGKCPAGFLETCETVLRPYSEGDNQAYQNVSFRSGTIGWDSSNYADGDAVYNNTVYRPRYDGVNAAPRPGEGRSRAENSVFNNIIVADARDPVGNYYGYLRWVSNTDSDGICTQSFIDHNLYFPVSATKHANFSANGHVSSSLSDWQAYLTENCTNPEVRETHSRVVDPLFVDALSGDFRLQADSPARTGGRGGPWPTALGAYVTGDEVVGCTFSELCHAKGYRLPPESEAPAKVRSVVRIDAR
jgi:hypothetical protein